MSSTTPLSSPWRTLEQAGKYTQTSTATLRREAKAGRLRGYRVGGRRCWRFKIEDLDAWLQNEWTERSAA
jgi:excisionase family DNA binding protein